MNDARIRLALFFTYEQSLRSWHEIGLFDREVALYRRLQARGVELTFLTYGGRDELDFAGALPGIRICCNGWGLPLRLYRDLMPVLHASALRRADLYKTNQMFGAKAALRSTKLWQKPLIARCGYMLSKNAAQEHGADSPFTRHARELERQVFLGAARIVVTTEAMSAEIAERLPETAARTIVVPNYVATEVFKPSAEPLESAVPRLCYVGRLSPEKNLAALIEAVTGLEVELEIVGKGPLRKELEAAAAGNPRVRFLGSVPNHEMPGILQRATAFVFPSLYEGHPKALIEAMACGLPVVATDVSGINDVIRHDENGWLCDTDAASLREGIRTVLGDRARRTRLGEAARKHAEEHYSLDSIAGQEMGIYQSVLAER